MSQNKEKALSQLAADIVKNNVCPELAQSAKQLVMGDGNVDANVLFIGEAPGKKEDESGIPFVGAAGKFLDEMLAKANLKRADVYITNIVKYRPPNNRDPSPEEKDEFNPYLDKQLEIIEPKIVVTLGRHSMEHFLPGMKISEVHGRAFRKRIKSQISGKSNGSSAMQDADEQRKEVYDEYSERVAQSATQQSTAKDGGVAGSTSEQTDRSIVFLPLYHPAAALYNGGLRQTLIDDFKKIPIILQKIN